MSTRSKKQVPKALQRAIEHQAEGALDASSVAKATVQTLIQINVILAPIIGEVGCNVLFKRAVHLTARTFSWLAIPENHRDTGDLFASLSICLADRDKIEAIEAGSTLLIGFTKLLTTLIGDPLVETLLGSLNESLTPSSKKKTPKQDAVS